MAHCASQMAHFKMPMRVTFVGSLPKNAGGKLLKRELRQRLVGGETLDKPIQRNVLDVMVVCSFLR